MTKSIFVPENIGRKFRDKENPHHVYTLLYITPSGMLVTSSRNGENIWSHLGVGATRFELVPVKETRYILWYICTHTQAVMANIYSSPDAAEIARGHLESSSFQVLKITTTSIEVN